MSGMAALPGALILIVGLSCYDLGLMDLLQLVFVYLGHFVVGWIYLLISPPFLPGAAAAKARANPFASKAKS